MSPEPMAPTDRVLLELLRVRPVIAIVGASSRLERASHTVMRRLIEEGYFVVPVNPNETEVLGRRCYPDLRAIPHRVDLVDVFRRADATPQVAQAAVEVGASILWLQLGVINAEAARIARAAGIIVVMDRCTLIEHESLIGTPFPRPVPEPEPPDPVGLCGDCRHARRVPTSGTTYWLCGRSADDPSFPKYPRLPVNLCRGFAWIEEGRPKP